MRLAASPTRGRYGANMHQLLSTNTILMQACSIASRLTLTYRLARKRLQLATQRLHPVAHLLACLSLYVSFFTFGFKLYYHGIVFSYGGSTFGQQILCVAASAFSLLASAFFASRLQLPSTANGIAIMQTMSNASGSFEERDHASPPEIGAIPLQVVHASSHISSTTVRSRYENNESHSIPETNNSSPLNPLLPTATNFNQPHLSCHSRLFHLVRNLLLVPSPLLVPFCWSVYAFYNPSDPGTALSAQINIILFTSIAVAIFVAIALLYMIVIMKKGKVICMIILPTLGGMILYFTLAFSNARTAYLSGIHSPAWLLSPSLEWDPQSGLSFFQQNPSLHQLLNAHTELGTLYPQVARSLKVPSLSMLDTPDELVRRHHLNRCVVHPYTHLADWIPRRSANFFTGREVCRGGASFSEVVWNDDAAGTTSSDNTIPPSTSVSSSGSSPSPVLALHTPSIRVNCPPELGELRITASPDWIAGRSMQSTNLVRHYREFYQQNAQARQSSSTNHESLGQASEAEVKAAIDAATGSRTHVGISSQLSPLIPAGSHSFFHLQCGAQENIHIFHVSDPSILARVKTDFDNKLFRDEFKSRQIPADDQVENSLAKQNMKKSVKKALDFEINPWLENPSVLLIFIDCVSRAHFHRSLPKTAAFLASLHVESSSRRRDREQFYQKQRSYRSKVEKLVALKTRQKDANNQREADSTKRESKLLAAHKLAKKEKELIREFVEIEHEILTYDKSSSRPKSFDSDVAAFSVYEHSLYHILDGHTRGNMQAMLCASGHSGWGGSLQDIPAWMTKPADANPQRKQFHGRGMPLPPRYLPGYHQFACEPKDFVWNRFKKAGYATSLVLNECCDFVWDQFGDVTRANSADYEVSAEFCHPMYDNYGKWSNFVGPYSMNTRCMPDSRKPHQHAIEYAKSFIQQHDQMQVPWFQYLSLVEGHEGSLAVLKQIDEELEQFLRFTLLQTKNPPLVMLVSDHGSHMGPFFEFTRAGRIEHKLPMLIEVIPEKWLRYHDFDKKAALLKYVHNHQVKQQQKSQSSKLYESPFTSDQQSVITHETVPPSPSQYFSQHPDPTSAASYASPFRPLTSNFYSHSRGLSLHENQYELVTARDIYWFLRRLPSRFLRDEASEEERRREQTWKETREDKHKQQWKSAQSEAKQTDVVAPENPSSVPGFAAEVDAIDIFPLAELLLTPAEPSWQVDESIPHDLMSPIPSGRRCEDVGIIDELCVCGKWKQ